MKARARLLLSVAAMGLTILTSGCMSCIGHGFAGVGGCDPYPGFRVHASTIIYASTGCKTFCMKTKDMDRDKAIDFLPISIIDLVPSTIVDTLFLPIDLPFWIVRKFQGKGSPEDSANRVRNI